MYLFIKWTFLICSMAVGMPITPISHAHKYYGRLRTYYWCYFLNFLHSGATNKSQTRLFNMSLLFNVGKRRSRKELKPLRLQRYGKYLDCANFFAIFSRN